MKTGNRIAFLRDQRGWTQEELSSSLGISRAALSHYEKNRREPDTETLAKIADLFGVSIDYLVGRTNRPDMIVDGDVREFVSQLELTSEVRIDGRRTKADPRGSQALHRLHSGRTIDELKRRSGPLRQIKTSAIGPDAQAAIVEVFRLNPALGPVGLQNFDLWLHRRFAEPFFRPFFPFNP